MACPKAHGQHLTVPSKTSLRFPRAIPISAAYEDLLRRCGHSGAENDLNRSSIFFRLLTGSGERLGRRSVSEITEHIFFESTNWSNLHERELDNICLPSSVG